LREYLPGDAADLAGIFTGRRSRPCGNIYRETQPTLREYLPGDAADFAGIFTGRRSRLCRNIYWEAQPTLREKMHLAFPNKALNDLLHSDRKNLHLILILHELIHDVAKLY
jgi:hypothetical protein